MEPKDVVEMSVQKHHDVHFDAKSVKDCACTASLTQTEEQRLWCRVDLRLIPIITVMYLFSFMDRGNIGNAKLDGLATQLKLTGNKYNMALTLFMIPYSIFEFPSNLVLQYIRPSRWIPATMALWGLILTCMGFVKTYPQLLGLRVCLGVAEAGFYPGVAYFLTMWYPRYMYQYRIALFSGAATLAGAFSGFLAYAINFMNGQGGLEGWSWIFILEGLATVVVALIATFVMVDSPSVASFLNQEERLFVSQKLQHAAHDDEHSVSQQVWAAFTDWQVWALSVIELSLIAPVYGITYFLPWVLASIEVRFLTKAQDHHSQFFYQSAAHGSTVCIATVVLLAFAHFSDKLQTRSPFVLASQPIALTGYVINISSAPSGVKYFGTFLCVAGSYAGFPGSISWLANNLGGRHKRAVGMAIQIGVGNLGGAIASNIYRAQDEPRYLLGHGLEVMFLGLGIVAVPFTVLAYKHINAQRDLERNAAVDSWNHEDKVPIGDRIASFRYTI